MYCVCKRCNETINFGSDGYCRKCTELLLDSIQEQTPTKSDKKTVVVSKCLQCFTNPAIVADMCDICFERWSAASEKKPMYYGTCGHRCHHSDYCDYCGYKRPHYKERKKGFKDSLPLGKQLQPLSEQKIEEVRLLLGVILEDYYKLCTIASHERGTKQQEKKRETYEGHLKQFNELLQDIGTPNCTCAKCGNKFEKYECCIDCLREIGMLKDFDN